MTKSFEVNVLIWSQPQPRIIHTTSIIVHQHHLEYVSTNQGGIFLDVVKEIYEIFLYSKDVYILNAVVTLYRAALTILMIFSVSKWGQGCI